MRTSIIKKKKLKCIRGSKVNCTSGTFASIVCVCVMFVTVKYSIFFAVGYGEKSLKIFALE